MKQMLMVEDFTVEKSIAESSPLNLGVDFSRLNPIPTKARGRADSAHNIVAVALNFSHCYIPFSS